MADQRIQATELVTGANHPTRTDTLNRLTRVAHNDDGTHKTLTDLAVVNPVITGNADASGANSFLVPTPTLAGQAATKGYADTLSLNVALPGQTGNAGKFVTTDGENASWAEIASLPFADNTILAQNHAITLCF